MSAVPSISGLSARSTADVVVVGAGLAGIATAAVLGRRHSVLLVDPRASCPPVFEAEKIEAPQAALLRDLQLLPLLLPRAARIDEISEAYAGHIFKRSLDEQYGLRYDAMVETLAAHLPSGVQRRLGRVVGVENSSEDQAVTLDDGSEVHCRLVILACGFHPERTGLEGLRRVTVQREQSTTFGFNVVPQFAESGREVPKPERLRGTFPFQALTYYATLGSPDRVDYLSLFRFREEMRANLFTFRTPGDPWARAFTKDPLPVLYQTFPRLRELIGPFAVEGRVEAAGVDLLRTEGDPLPGVVLIGDAQQTACPSTGTGLTRVLTDVHLLSELVPMWLASPGMGLEKTTQFTLSERRREANAASLSSAAYRRSLAMDRSLRWRLHRKKLEMGMLWGAARLHLRRPAGAASSSIPSCPCSRC